MAIYNGDNNDNIHNGTNGVDTIHGNGGNDTLGGLGGNDRIFGDGGNDILNGGLGNDNLEGGSGEDTYIIAKIDGQDVIYNYDTDGSLDAVTFTDVASTAVTVSRSNNGNYDLILTYGTSGQLTVQGYFEDANQYVNEFRFSDGVVWGWQQIGLDDYPANFATPGVAVVGGSVTGTVEVEGDNDWFKVNLLAGQNYQIDLEGTTTGKGTLDDPYIRGIYNSVGILMSGTVDDDGGQGLNAQVFFTPSVSGNYFIAAGDYHGYWENNVGTYRLTIPLGGSEGDDQLDGDSGNNSLSGFGGNDTLNGKLGNDTLNGGLGNDTYLIAKNDGVDVIDDAGGTDVLKFTDLADTGVTETSRVGDYGYDLLLKYGTSQVTVGDYFYDSDTRIEQFQFSNGVTWGWADIKAKVLKATAGDDTLYGYNDSGDTLNGLAGNDTLYGYDGNDTLDGGAGDDVMLGGAGNDSYWVDSLGDTVHEDYYDGGIDSVSSSVDFKLLGNAAYVEKLTLLAGAVKAVGNGLDNILTGNAAVNALTGLDGNDTLIGADGNDSLQGGLGSDTINGGNGVDFAHYWTATAGVTVNLGLATAQNTVGAGIDTLSNIENLNGSGFNDTLTGNAQNNSLLGGAGNDVLNGGDGNDSLQGGLGSDTLNGGNGVDWAQYYLATARVTVNLGLATAQNTVGAGIDTLINIENLNGSGFNDTLTGNALTNALVGGSGNDKLNGGLGNDLLTGGAGQDSFVFNTAIGVANRDRITDFSVADDTINLENAIFTALTAPGTLSAAAFKVIGAGNAVDADDRIFYNTATGGVLYDADGNGSSAAVLITVIGQGLAVTQADFVVI